MRLMKAAPAALVFTLAFAAAAAQTSQPTNRPPTVKLTASSGRVVQASNCDRGQPPVPACTPTASTVRLLTEASDPDGNRLLYTYSTTGGRIDGDGPEVTLDLTGVAPGVYKVTLKVDDGRGGVAFDTAAVTSERCSCSEPTPFPPCPTVTVTCPDSAGPDGRLTFTAHVSGGDPNVTPTFKWKVEGANIVAGQGTSAVTLNLVGVYSDSLTAAVEVGGYESACQTTSACSRFDHPAPQARKLDEYGDILVGDEKALLGNFAIELQNDPAALAHLICYGGRRGGALAARRRCRRAANYLGSGFLGVNDSRIVIVEGGRRESLTVELWVVPSGAAAPRPTPFAAGRGRR